MNDSMALVTGSPGWLGTRLVETLLNGLSDVPGLERPSDRIVRCLVQPGVDVAPLRALGKQVEIVEGELPDPAAVARLCDGAKGATLFHAAGIIHPTRGIRQFYSVNLEGTKALLASATQNKVRRFVHVSSNSPIGCNPTEDHVFDESAAFNPYMNYGKSKMMAEQLLADTQKAGALETVVIRPPWFYGPNQPARQSLFFTMIRQGKVPLVGPGNNRRSMAYIDNICQGLLLCEKIEKTAGQTYWIADRRPYTMNEILSTIEDVMEKHFGVTVAHKRMRLPGFASDVAYLCDGILQGVGLYQQKIHVLSEMNKTIACSIAKAEHELGYDPKVDLAEGMRRSLAWLNEKGIKW